MSDTTPRSEPDMSPEAIAARRERYARRDEADRSVDVRVAVGGLRPEFVHVRPVRGYPGHVCVELGGSRLSLHIDGTVDGMRAVTQEIDRQLARLEVEHRVDEVLADEHADPEGEAS